MSHIESRVELEVVIEQLDDREAAGKCEGRRIRFRANKLEGLTRKYDIPGAGVGKVEGIQGKVAGEVVGNRRIS